jgi:hypothetical protein
VGVEVGAGQEEHVLGSINHPVGVEQLAEAQRAATQQRPASGELAGLVLAEDRVALGDLEQGPEPRLQLRPATKHARHGAVRASRRAASSRRRWSACSASRDASHITSVKDDPSMAVAEAALASPRRSPTE